MRVGLWAVGLLLSGCTTTDEPVVEDDTSAPAPVETCEPPEADADCELVSFGSGARCGDLVRDGEGTVTPVDAPTAFSGTDALIFSAEFGYGEVLCEIQYDVVSVASRTDCPDLCGTEGWAFDMEFQNPRVVTEVEDACDVVLEVLCLDSLEELAGQTVTRGYDPDWTGHGATLMEYSPTGGWDGGTLVSYDDKEGRVQFFGVPEGIHAY